MADATSTTKYGATILVWPCNGNGVSRVFVGYFPTKSAARREAANQLADCRPDSRGGYDIWLAS